MLVSILKLLIAVIEVKNMKCDDNDFLLVFLFCKGLLLADSFFAFAVSCLEIVDKLLGQIWWNKRQIHM